MNRIIPIVEGFSDAVLRHIDTYTVPQYGDYPDDNAADYTILECLWQIRKYATRYGRNQRPGQNAVDMIKIGHYAGLALSKKIKINLSGIKPRPKMTIRGMEWAIVSGFVQTYLMSHPAPDIDDPVEVHVDSIQAYVFEAIESFRQVESGAEMSMEARIYNRNLLAYVLLCAAIAWSKMPAVEHEDAAADLERRRHA